jgi:hypothetical protein
MLEGNWLVQISNYVLKVTDPELVVQHINLVDINRIAIQTNDTGPIGFNVIWHISD